MTPFTRNKCLLSNELNVNKNFGTLISLARRGFVSQLKIEHVTLGRTHRKPLVTRNLMAGVASYRFGT
jgi:hypothetical protein